ncbi:hypothetical protein CSW58_03940 [Caulobacter sp. B11]|nr:hypothetical protein CSW58_03940 [Caulobacter sp. B11]
MAEGPLQAAGRAIGLVEGEPVEIEVKGGDIIIRRPEAQTEGRIRALAAVERIIANRRGKTRAGITLRELIDEGRR